MKENNVTKAWQLYELGRQYNESLVPNQYNVVQTNTEFFIGNQWLNLPDTQAMRGLPKPTFNILKRVASLFIASLTSSGAALHFEPLAYYDGGRSVDPDHSVAQFANAAVANLLEKFKFDYRLRDALFDGAQTGDYCAHFWFDPTAKPYGGMFGPHMGEIQMELVDGINVMFGNPNDRRVQEQPYIIVLGRDTVENLRYEAEYYKKHKAEYGKPGKEPTLMGEVVADHETDDFLGIGGRTEILSDAGSGKALYLYLYTKQESEVEKIDPRTGKPMMEDVIDANGDPVITKDAYGLPTVKQRPVKEKIWTIHVTKATRTAVIYEDVDTGMSQYPLAWGNWEKQKNQYHGRALVTGLLPNQIFINSMFATAMRHMQLMAFPKTVYNADLISAWTNEVGQAIGVHGLQPGMSISQVATNLQPSEMSNQIFALIDKAMAYTKECLGATDAQMGNVKPDNTSALMVLQTNAEVPLENVRSNTYEWIEDIAAILLDMIGTYYGERPIVVEQVMEEPVSDATGAPRIDPMTGMMQMQTMTRKVVQTFDFSVFKHLFLNVRVDVGATTYFSEIAMTQTLDNLRRDGTLDVIQYLERLPDKLIPKKQQLIDELRGRIAHGEQANAAAGAAIPEPGAPIKAAAGAATEGAPLAADGGLAVAQGGPLSFDKQVAGLPTMAEAKYNELPNIAKKSARFVGNLHAD